MSYSITQKEKGSETRIHEQSQLHDITQEEQERNPIGQLYSHPTIFTLGNQFLHMRLPHCTVFRCIEVLKYIVDPLPENPIFARFVHKFW